MSIEIKKLKNSKAIVLVTGKFNVLHPGHLRLLKFAKECGSRLIVAVESDLLAGKSAHVSEKLRLEGVQSNTFVNEAFIYHDSVIDVIKKLHPDIVVKGKEYENCINPEQNELDTYGGKLIFSSGETLFSSLDLLRREFDDIDLNSISIPFDYHKRHDIEIDKLKKIVNSFRKLKICVIGDLIVDEYITCQPLGMSQEDTSIVVAPIDSSLFIGGASIVAAHASGLGANVKFISVTGNDSSRAYALDKLKEYGVSSYLLIDDNRPTSLKQRYRCNGKSLLRVSHLHQSAISAELQDEIIKIIDKEINEIDLLIFSDFNYGCLPQSLVKKIIERMKLRNVILAADSQSSSQVGDISRFNNMDLITPTEREARISTRNHEDGLVILAEALKKQANAKNIILKLGEEGILIHADINEKSNWLTDKVKALNKSPKDVSGAGDSLLIASALTLAAGGSIWEAASIGSVAAAIQVGRVGNIPIRLNEVLQELN